MYLLGLDIGTTGVKAAVFDRNGIQKGYGFKEYGILCPKPGYAEQDAEEVWRVSKSVMKQAVSGIGSLISAISISVQGDAIIPVDANGNALCNAHLGMDYRGVSEVSEFSSVMDERQTFKLTGMRPHPLNSLIKILWIKNNLPDLYAKAYKFVTYADFILAKLGSDGFAIDYTMASRTMAFDINTMNWSESILKAVGVDKEKLSTAVPSGTVVGKILPNLAEEMGINMNAKIVAGGHDQTCAALGAGVISEQYALDSHGTAEVVSTAFSTLRLNDVMFDSYYPCYAHAVPDTFFTFALNHTGGVSLKWFVETFCKEDVRLAEESGESVYKHIDRHLPKKPSSVMVLPHFNGSGTPTCDLNSKGMFAGLTLSTNQYDIAKAILESLSFEIRINLETMAKAGIVVDKLRCVGGGARSPEGLQNKADILGIPVSTLKTREAACLGASLLAGIASGAFSNVSEAVSVVKTAETYEPCPEYQRIYQERYLLYKEMYGNMKGILHKL